MSGALVFLICSKLGNVNRRVYYFCFHNASTDAGILNAQMLSLTTQLEGREGVRLGVQFPFSTSSNDFGINNWLIKMKSI